MRSAKSACLCACAASKQATRIAEGIPALHDIGSFDELSFCLVSEVSADCSARQHTSQMQATDRGKGKADALQDSRSASNAGPCTHVHPSEPDACTKQHHCRNQRLYITHPTNRVPSPPEDANPMTRPYFVSTAGNVSSSVIERYLQAQRGR